MKTPIAFRLDARLVLELRHRAECSGISQAKLVERALQKYFARGMSTDLRHLLHQYQPHPHKPRLAPALILLLSAAALFSAAAQTNWPERVHPLRLVGNTLYDLTPLFQVQPQHTTNFLVTGTITAIESDSVLVTHTRIEYEPLPPASRDPQSLARWLAIQRLAQAKSPAKLIALAPHLASEFQAIHIEEQHLIRNFPFPLPVGTPVRVFALPISRTPPCIWDYGTPVSTPQTNVVAVFSVRPSGLYRLR